MMTRKSLLFLMVLALSRTIHPLHGQQPYIESLSRNGELVTTNLPPGSGSTVEWAPAVDGPWRDVWTGLRDVVADSNGTLRVEVPMFYRIRVSNPDPARLVWIQPGTFLMGSPANEAERGGDERQHEVTISRGFWMGKYEVTQGEYLDVVGSNPSFWRNGGVGSEFGGPVTNELLHPVEVVTWVDCTNYCALLTERERVAGRVPEGYVYRLPTEAEWEYACRAGTRTAFHYGAALISGMANFNGGYEYVSTIGYIEGQSINGNLGRTAEVGSYEPNRWGLYDMHGSVWEWCQDEYAAYPEGPVTDPMGPEMGLERVYRGGGWYDLGGEFCRSAQRKKGDPYDTFIDDLGFRVVLAAFP
jgi:formylglycine-generating enzyme required for sulfatase activity